MSRKKIVIVGGGIVGLATAYYAARRGHGVTIIERGAPPAAGCATGSAGMIAPSHFVPLAAPGAVLLGLRWMFDPQSPFYVTPRLSTDLFRWGWRFMRAANAAHVARSAPLLRDLSLASRAGFEEWADEFRNEFGLVKRGLLMLCRTEQGLHEEVKTAAVARALGMPADVLTCEQIAKLDPALRCAGAGGVYYPQDCHLDPQKLVATLAKGVAGLGVEVAWSTVPRGWGAAGGQVRFVDTNHGRIEGDEFVLAAGVWSTSLARELGIDLPMQAGRGYSMTLPSPRRLPEICAILTEARVAVTPMGGALRFGGTMEIVATPHGDPPPVNPARVRGITGAVPRYLPEFTAEDFRHVEVWSGLRPCSPDGMPYIGRFRRYANLSAATGHAMMGVTLAPVTGRLMAEILSGDEPSIDIGALRPDRYHCR